MEQLSRRQLLQRGLAVAGAGLLAGCDSGAPFWSRPPAAGEPPPETTTLRLAYHSASLCHAPLYLAEELLQGEGFTDVQYVRIVGVERALASGQVDIATHFCGPLSIQVDRGDPIVLLAGLHPGCVELVGTAGIRSIADLKGKTIAVTDVGGGRHAFLAVIAAYVGLDPRTDLNIVAHPAAEAMRLLAAGEIDAFLAAPPDAQELRAKQIGHVVVNSMADRPWYQYFCCLVAGNRDFSRTHPVATKRTLRAILQAADLCAREPERAARFLVDRGYATQYDSALQAMQEMGMAYGKWREYDPEDTVRFYALRLHEVGMVAGTPQKILAQGTDWRFLNELKRELKA
jgi:NitT/TauT family transport system substrate-binding protein